MRCAVMDYILAPIGTWAGLRKKKATVRFAEQAWIMLYYGAFWVTGMVSPRTHERPFADELLVHLLPL